MGLMRDHYEGTPYDMTKGVDAGPFGSPYRFRDLAWKVDGISCSWERPISTQQAGFVMVAQSRKWLPDPVGGVYWFTPDDAYTSCFTPLYCGINALPEPYLKGDHNRFSWDSAWWVFNMVSNLTYDRWSRDHPRRPGRPARAGRRDAQDAAGHRGDGRQAGPGRPGVDAHVPDGLLRLHGGRPLPPLARAGRADPDQAQRWICQRPHRDAEGGRLLSGVAPQSPGR